MPSYRINYTLKRYYTIETHADSKESALKTVSEDREGYPSMYFDWNIDHELERAVGHRSEFVSHIIDSDSGEQKFPDDKGLINMFWSRGDNEYSINTVKQVIFSEVTIE